MELNLEAIELDIDAVKGDTFSFDVLVKDQDDVILNLTGYEMMLTAKSNVNLADASAELQDVAVIATPANGIGVFNISSVKMSIDAKKYNYDIQISTAASPAVVYTVKRGTLTIVEHITRTTKP